MHQTRRRFVSRIAASGVALSPAVAAAPAQTQIRAIAFDAFPILDPRPVFALAAELFPALGGELGNLWRQRQFEYTWLRTIAGRYADFWQVTGEALDFAARALNLHLTAETRGRLMGEYLKLRCWPDAPDVLRSLRRAGIRLAFLSNLTAPMLQAGIRNSGLEDVFDYVLSTDRVRAFKPDPRAYRMGLDAFRLKRQQILFAAFAGWDAAGAKSFGYPTFWVNRQDQPEEELGVSPDRRGRGLTELAGLVLGSESGSC